MIQIFETSKLGKRHEAITPTQVDTTHHEEIIIHDDFDQTMQGFGGAFTEASAYNLSRINKEVRNTLIKAYFDPKEGIGYILGRVSINSSDFGLSTYDYVDAFDETLASFDISRDQHIIDVILEAQKIAGKDIEILASPWSPPLLDER